MEESFKKLRLDLEDAKSEDKEEIRKKMIYSLEHLRLLKIFRKFSKSKSGKKDN
jgi:precorrin isomerase